MTFFLLAACAGEIKVTADSTVVVEGLSDSTRLRVSVAGETTRIVGRHEVSGARLVFRPIFPFDPGREYDVAIDGEQTLRFKRPAPKLVPSTSVMRVFPTSDTLPANQLRLYIEFSAPMSRDGGLPYVHLLDADGSEVTDAFLPLDADFWNRERTRYTLFLDPGRVKRGILPNREMGRALVAGKRYSIVVDSTWRDGRGQPLVAPATKDFLARAADLKPIRLDGWTVTAPPAGTRDPLVVRFPEPLDHGLLRRAIDVEGAAASITGSITVGNAEREWRFVPDSAWAAGAYRIVVLDILEDLAGNRVNRPFEVDRFERVDSVAAPSRFTLPFRVR
jgi:hypothetical protein